MVWLTWQAVTIVCKICQNLLLESSQLKTVALGSWAKVSSTWGKDVSLGAHLKGFRLRQMPTLPFFLGIMSIPVHQSVGTSTLEMTPKASMWLSSSWNYSRRVMGIFLADKLEHSGPFCHTFGNTLRHLFILCIPLRTPWHLLHNAYCTDELSLNGTMAWGTIINSAVGESQRRRLLCWL